MSFVFNRLVTLLAVVCLFCDFAGRALRNSFQLIFNVFFMQKSILLGNNVIRIGQCAHPQTVSHFLTAWLWFSLCCIAIHMSHIQPGVLLEPQPNESWSLLIYNKFALFGCQSERSKMHSSKPLTVTFK